MSMPVTVTPTALVSAGDEISAQAALAGSAANDVVEVDPIAFTKALEPAAATGLPPALAGARAICEALQTVTAHVDDLLQQAAKQYRDVEQDNAGLAGSITSSLKGLS